MKFLKFLLVVALAAAAFGGGYVFRASKATGAAGASGERKVLYWVDPMHPAYKSDKPGIAPDCGMALEPVYADEPAGPPADRTVLYYRDPEDHNYKADKAGLNPETGNTLEPVYADAPSTMPAGAVRIPTERQQLIGVKYGEAEWSDSARTLRTVGTVAFDETRIAKVHPRIEGWVERVFVNVTGGTVREGQPLLAIYSPELLASQQELLLARRARDLMANNPLVSAADGGSSLLDAARRRLELWDLSPAQIDRVLETGTPIRSVTLHSPASGFVLQRSVFPNQRVTPDTELYTIADLSRVWIMADVFEADIPHIRPGMKAHVTFTSGAAPLDAKVAYVQPQVDPATRTLKVRLEAPNPGTRLKPDMFVNVELTLAGSRQLTVPAGAVVDTGTRQTVFIDLGNGYIDPRQVVAGERLGDRIVITSGLKGGERVVASGTFLIDSESQLKAAVSSMGAPQEHKHD
ncbi:MAG TPA: efflux RND transporter periplasmic adaptor subunit [Vicinamibacterales bacterium]|nr:efflux RND transporter periplasmic adaptor subunit [Vicinamibacterales bacterium]